MADLIAIANGNLTAAGTWGTVDAGSKNDSEAASTLLTTSNQDSSAFTPGAITIDGIAVKFKNRAVSPSGTLTLTLRNSTGSIDVATVTINISDIPSDSVTNNTSGWVFFNTGTTLLIAATNYIIRLKTSASSQITAFSSATTNWSRMLRTTTTAAPGANDQMLICGEWTAAATQTTRTVTMDSTSLATSYGNLNICLGGTMTWGTTASTAYQLSLTGLLNLYGGGTYNMGTSGTPMPASSSGILEFNCGSNVQYGAEIFGGTINAYGNAITNVSAKLAADASAAATSLTTDITTGWKNGDVVAITSTTRTNTECESKALGADASGTSIGTIAALTNAHGGNSTTKVQAELANLTRNVKIRGVSTSLQAYMNIRVCAVVNFSYGEFYQFGSATANKVGIDFNSVTTTTGSRTIVGCSFHDFIVTSSQINHNAITQAISLTNSIFYNINAIHLNLAAAGNQSSTITGCYFILNVTSTAQLINNLPLDNTCTVNNLVIAGGALSATNGGAVLIFAAAARAAVAAFMSGSNIHSNAGNGVIISGLSLKDSTFDTCTFWRNGNSGVWLSNSSAITTVAFKSCIFFGNATSGIQAGINSGSGMAGLIACYNCTFDGGTTLTQPRGMHFSGFSPVPDLLLDGCTFGATNTHSTADISNTSLMRITERNCLLASATEYLSSGSALTVWGYIRQQKHDQTTGNHQTQFREGTVSIDTTIYDTTPSQRLAPNSNSNSVAKLKSAPIRIPIASGQTCQISVKVRTSVVGDGAAYNGNRARLMLEINGALGVTADTVAATATVASDGAFETLTYTTPSAGENGVWTFYVDCDGTAGWINVDTITVA